jgi:hypothetical protein
MAIQSLVRFALRGGVEHLLVGRLAHVEAEPR